MRTRKFLSTLIPALPMLLTALLVILVTVIFLTAMRSKAHAQFGGIEQPMFALASTETTSITNDGALAYYWNYQDPTNTIVTNWIDRIQGLLLESYTPNVGPLKNSQGLWFTNSAIRTMLTNVPIPHASNSLFGIILSPTSHGSSYSTYISTTNTDALWTLAGSGTPVDVDWNAPPAPNWAQDLAINKMNVIMFSWSNTFTSCWTNGLHSRSVAFTTVKHPAIRHVGGTLAQTAANCYLGSIREVIIFTNLLDPQPYVSNYWHYATNTYGIP